MLLPLLLLRPPFGTPQLLSCHRELEILQAAIYPNFSQIRKQKISNLGETLRWDIIDKYNQKASPYKKINKFIILKEELPKTRLGKIQRFKLAEMLTDISTKKHSNNDSRVI